MRRHDDLWAASRGARLSSARALTNDVLDEVHEALRRGRDEPGWPYGSATSINPLLVVLGPSPGSSPRRGDRHFVTREPFTLPTAGEPHPGVWYDDPRGCWNKVRDLARTLLDADGALGDDALALFGTMNLSTAASGSASDAILSAPFARWTLATIRDGLRPRVLVLLGLRTLIRTSHGLSALFEEAFEGLDARRPYREHPLEVYRNRRLVFKEWNLTTPRGAPLLLVDWPQHPNRSQFTSAPLWRAACKEFADRHQSLLE